MSFASQVFAPLLVLASIGCGGAAEIPATPDLSQLISNYDEPDGQLDATRAAMVVADAPPMPTLAAGIRATGLIANHVDDASDDTAPRSGSGIRLQGSIKIDLRCPGDPSHPVYDPAVNGTASLTVAIANSAIKRTIGGVAHACLLKSTVNGQDVSIRLDDTIAFDLGRDIGIGQHWSGRLLAYLPGTLSVGDYDFRSVSARFTDTEFEHLIGLSDGTFVVLTLSGDGLSVRDRNGTWHCPSDGSACTPG